MDNDPLTPPATALDPDANVVTLVTQLLSYLTSDDRTSMLEHLNATHPDLHIPSASSASPTIHNATTATATSNPMLPHVTTVQFNDSDTTMTMPSVPSTTTVTPVRAPIIPSLQPSPHQLIAASTQPPVPLLPPDVPQQTQRPDNEVMSPATNQGELPAGTTYPAVPGPLSVQVLSPDVHSLQEWYPPNYSNVDPRYSTVPVPSSRYQDASFRSQPPVPPYIQYQPPDFSTRSPHVSNQPPDFSTRSPHVSNQSPNVSANLSAPVPQILFASPPAAPSSMYYAIRHGRSIGIVRDWPTCSRLVNGSNHNMFKGFRSLTYANQYMLAPSDASAFYIGQEYGGRSSPVPPPHPASGSVGDPECFGAVSTPFRSSPTRSQQSATPSTPTIVFPNGLPTVHRGSDFPPYDDSSYVDVASILDNRSVLHDDVSRLIAARVDDHMSARPASSSSLLMHLPPVKKGDFPELTPSDYLSWADEVDLFLTADEWLPIAGNPVPSPLTAALSKRLYMHIIVNMNDDLRSRWLQRHDLKLLGIELLSAIRDEYEPDTPQHLLGLHAAWTKLAQGPSEDTQSFGFRIQRLVSRLANAGQPYCMEIQVLTFLNGLDQHRFGPYVLAFQTGSRDITGLDLSGVMSSARTFLLHNPTNVSVAAAGSLVPGPTPPSVPSAPVNRNAWIGSSNITDGKAIFLLRQFRCPLHRSDTHTLSECIVIQPYYTCTFIKAPDAVQPNNRSSSRSSTPAPSSVPPAIPRPPAPRSATASRAIGPISHPADADPPITSDPTLGPPTAPVPTTPPQAPIATPPDSPNNSDSSFVPLSYPYGAFAAILTTNPVPLVACAARSPSGSVITIIDSGATRHMWNDPGAFIDLQPSSGSFVRVADDRHLPVTGVGTIQISLCNKAIRLKDVLLVPLLAGPLFSIRSFRRLPGCGFFASNDQCCLAFPTFVIPIDDKLEVSLPTINIPHATKFDYDETPPIATAFVATRSGKTTSPIPAPEKPSFHPPVRPCDLPNSSAPIALKLTNHELHRYLGFRSLKDYKVLESTSHPSLQVVNQGEIPLDLADVATIPRGRRGGSRPSSITFLDDVYMDIGYGDGRSIRGFTHCLVLVDSCTRYVWCYGLKDLGGLAITAVLRLFFIEAGHPPLTMHCDFDYRLMGGDARALLTATSTRLVVAPSGRQSQNGLVEGNWKTMVRMARSFLTDRQMPKRFWYYALRHAAQVMNYFPGLKNGVLTSPFELVHNQKPDFRILFRLFSVGFFRHITDAARARTKFEAQSLTGIAIGRAADSNAMEFYSPVTKEIYTSADYKLDSCQTTTNYFPQLQYDGAIILGLYSPRSHDGPEPFPPNTEVFLTHDSSVARGFVTSVPLPSNDPTSRHVYIVRLTTGQLIEASQAELRSSHDAATSLDSNQDIDFTLLPTWISLNSKITLDLDGIMTRGVLSFDAHHRWCFEQRSKNGKVLKFHALYDLPHTWEERVTSLSLFPGWQSPSAFRSTLLHVSALHLKEPCPPGLRQALDYSFADREIWLDSYYEEYNSLLQEETFVVINHAQYLALREQCGNALPSMCVLCIKKDSQGNPDRAKSRIVVLGNLELTLWTKGDCYAPVVAHSDVRLLVSMAVQVKRVVKQLDAKKCFLSTYSPCQ